MIDKLIMYMQFPFVQYALIVGVLIALCSSLLGVTLVVKRFSYIGDGLSHVAFGAMAIASVLNLTNNMWLIMSVTIVSDDISGSISIWVLVDEYFFNLSEPYG